jgi:hypothetical protein
MEYHKKRGIHTNEKNRCGQFKKKDFVRIFNFIIDLSLRKFGYTKRPYVCETRMEKGVLAALYVRERLYVIFYDYKQFRASYRMKDYETNVMFTVLNAAHEIRHYYQVRQIYSKHPREDEKTIAEWRQDHFHGKDLGDEGCKTLLDVYKQPMELDAELYAYVTVAKLLDKVVDYGDDEFIKILRNKYVEMFGEDDEDLYIFNR